VFRIPWVRQWVGRLCSRPRKKFGHVVIAKNAKRLPR